MQSVITIESLNDNLLSDYVGRMNLQYILLVNKMVSTKEGSKQYGNAVVELRTCEARYKKAVVEAISRGILLTN